MPTKLNIYAVAIIGFLIAGTWTAIAASGSASDFNVQDVARGAGLTFLALTYYFAAFVIVHWQKSVGRKDDK